jgi:hypothetical protein
MKANVGKVDRAVRVIAGLAIIGAGFYYQNWWGVVGVVPLLTAITKFCPAYTLFGMTTCGSCEAKDGQKAA